MRKLSHFRLPQLKKRFIIVGSLLSVIIATGVYVLWSKQVWDDYQPSYTQWHQSIKDDTDKAVALPAASVEERTTALVALKKVTQQIGISQDKVCVMHPLVQWQQKLIAKLDEAQIACRKEVDKTTTFKTSLNAIVLYIEDDQELAKIMMAIPQPDEVADDNWEKQVIAWDGAIKSTEKLSVSDSFKPTQQLAIAQMTKMKAAWQGVIAAHQAKDKAAYLTAQGALASAIDELDMIATTSQKTVADLSRQLEAASDATFH